MKAINVDAPGGVTIMRQKTNDGGMYIYMYNSQPGTYLNAHGKEIPEALAAEVGFPVDKFRKERIKREKMAQYMSQIEAELEMLSSDGEEVVLHEGNGYKIVAVNEDSANVFTSEGDKLNTTVLPNSAAITLFEKLTGLTVGGTIDADEDDGSEGTSKGKGK